MFNSNPAVEVLHMSDVILNNVTWTMVLDMDMDIRNVAVSPLILLCPVSLSVKCAPENISSGETLVSRNFVLQCVVIVV